MRWISPTLCTSAVDEDGSASHHSSAGRSRLGSEQLRASSVGGLGSARSNSGNKTKLGGAEDGGSPTARPNSSSTGVDRPTEGTGVDRRKDAPTDGTGVDRLLQAFPEIALAIEGRGFKQFGKRRLSEPQLRAVQKAVGGCRKTLPPFLKALVKATELLAKVYVDGLLGPKDSSNETSSSAMLLGKKLLPENAWQRLCPPPGRTARSSAAHDKKSSTAAAPRPYAYAAIRRQLLSLGGKRRELADFTKAHHCVLFTRFFLDDVVLPLSREPLFSRLKFLSSQQGSVVRTLFQKGSRVCMMIANSSWDDIAQEEEITCFDESSVPSSLRSTPPRSARKQVHSCSTGKRISSKTIGLKKLRGVSKIDFSGLQTSEGEDSGGENSSSSNGPAPQRFPKSAGRPRAKTHDSGFNLRSGSGSNHETGRQNMLLPFPWTAAFRSPLFGWLTSKKDQSRAGMWIGEASRSRAVSNYSAMAEAGMW